MPIYVENTSLGSFGGAAPSQSIWGNCPLDEYRNGRLGIFHRDDFLYVNAGTSDLTSPMHTAQGTYSIFGDTGVTFKDTAAQGGVLQIAGIDADNDAAIITMGHTADAGAFVITANSGQKLWYEARVKWLLVTNITSTMIGLAKGGLLTSDLYFTDTTATQAVIDSLGFRVLDDDGDELDTFYATDSGAVVEHEDGTAALTADTWVKLGMYFDGVTTVNFYVDGLLVDTVEVSVANFPDTIPMSPVFAVKSQSTTEQKFSIDWFQIAQTHSPT